MLDINKLLADKIRAAALRANLTVNDFLEKIIDESSIEFGPILENLPDVIYTFDLSARKVDYINRDAFLGYPISVVTQPQSLMSKLLPKDIERLQEHWSAITTSSQDDASRVNFQLNDANDQWHWIKMRHVVLTRQSNGTPQKILIHLTDVTNIKQAEREATRNEQRLKSIIAAMSEGIVFQRSDGTIEACNESAQRILGLTLDQMMGRTSMDPRWRAIREDGTPFAGEEHPAMITLNTGEPAEDVIMGVYKPDGELTWISINTQPLFQNGDDRPYAVVSTFTDITRQKTQEAQLRLLTQAVEQSPVSVIITDTDACINYVNPQFSQLTGYELSEVKGKNPRLLQSGLTPRETYAEMWNTLTSGEVWRGVMINRKKNGDIYYEQATIAPIKNTHGETSHYVAVKEDITERKQVESALQVSEREAREFQQYLKTLHEMSLELAGINSLNNLYRLVVETGLNQLDFDRVALFLIDDQAQTIVGTYGTDPDGNIRPEFDYQSSLKDQEHWLKAVLANHERAMLWEEAPIIDYNTIVGSGWNAMAGLWDGDNVIGFIAVDNYLSGRPPRAYEHELLSLYGKTAGHLVSRQRGLHALRQSEERIRTLMQHAPTGIIVTDLDGRIESSNAQTVSLLQYDNSDQIVGKSIQEFLPALPGPEDLTARKTLHLGLGHDLFARRRDGSTIPVEVVLTRITLRDRPRLVLFVNNLSPHIEVEQHRIKLAIETERSNVLAKFIQDASHEFRTPLTIIKNRSFLVQSVAENDKIKQNVEKIDAQADRIVSLVEDLAYIARLDSMTEMVLEPHNVIDVIKSTFPEFDHDLEARNITLTFSSSYKIPKVLCHVHELGEALERIINNAIRYNHDGGTVNITCLQEDNEVITAIKDTGDGIDAAHLPYIFDRFYRMDTAHTTRGFGLGLAIAKKIISLHNGTISAESELSSGTTIRIKLPV